MSVHLINFVHTFYLYVFLLYEQTLSVALCVQFSPCLYKNKNTRSCCCELKLYLDTLLFSQLNNNNIYIFLNQESHVCVWGGVISQTLFCEVVYLEVQGYGSFVKTAKHRFLGDPA